MFAKPLPRNYTLTDWGLDENFGLFKAYYEFRFTGDSPAVKLSISFDIRPSFAAVLRAPWLSYLGESIPALAADL